MKNKTSLEHHLEAVLAETTRQIYIKEKINEYNIKQRMRRGMELITAIDDEYVCNMSKAMFGNDIDLNPQQIEVLRPICIEIALEELEKLYPIVE